MTVVNLHAILEPTMQDPLGEPGELALVSNFMAPRASVAERFEAGKALRRRVPRKSGRIALSELTK